MRFIKLDETNNVCGSAIAPPQQEINGQIVDEPGWIEVEEDDPRLSQIGTGQPIQANINWQGFMDRLDLAHENNPNGTGLFAVILAINEVAAWQSYNMCLLMIRGGGFIREIRTLNFIYQSMSPALTSEQVTQLKTAVADFNIPITI